jgi:hypothetical protein
MWPTVCTSMLQAHTNMPGLRHSVVHATIRETWCRAPSYKPQASSSKLCKVQASSSKLLKVQAASFKPQAASIKLQATSCKLFNVFSFVKFRDARSERLYSFSIVMTNRCVSLTPNNLFSINCIPEIS